CCRPWPRSTSSCGHRPTRWPCTTSCSNDSRRAPSCGTSAAWRYISKAASRTPRRAIAAPWSSSRRTPSRRTIWAWRSITRARPEFAEAHYNMSFALSNLGDFEGALRETKRALELDPYYVPQKFELAMEVEYEDPDLSIQPDFGDARAAEAAISDFSFDPRTL